ncbi:DNA replication complex GINS protein PSF3-like [Halichondria panicea]|uniref:DNA replication complex GINS protein PSF3-like n=1 Tax=Halichondria panicea TaxID=6063 RepID=UPI00312BB397
MSSTYQTSVSFSGSSHTGSYTSSLPPNEDYFSIDDILSSDQRVPCQFELPIYRLGFLDPSTSNEHLESGTKLELPFWLAKVLCTRKKLIVSVELPKAFREGQRDILSADAKVVDLYKLGPFYYSLGVKLLCFDHLERGDLSKSLLEAFLNRFRLIMDTSQHAYQSSTTALTAKLDETERKLFVVGQKAMADFENWERGLSHKIHTSSIVRNSRKRKRDEVEK